MTAAKKPAAKASPSSGEVARGEVADPPAAKTVNFRGLDLALPAMLPAAIAFDFAELEAAGGDSRPIFRLLRSILGGEQFTDVRNLLSPTDELAAVIDELLEGIFSQYGLTPGE